MTHSHFVSQSAQPLPRRDDRIGCRPLSSAEHSSTATSGGLNLQMDRIPRTLAEGRIRAHNRGQKPSRLQEANGMTLLKCMDVSPAEDAGQKPQINTN
ncbi:hypothetical protein JTE90_002931 [Oedothorax gibbosus]|uniref:Uncharacterized protein n=1 Tax=Oedothorax gibbosus TaxID=931172 RepID=A0AAV6UWS7_9ARAC|nr:hypothetical protein JTE90_002931 [Oedothorax gibbosus]